MIFEEKLKVFIGEGKLICGPDISHKRFGNRTGKAIPATVHEGPWGYERSSFPHFLYNRLTDGGEVVDLNPPAGRPLSPGSFLVLVSVRGCLPQDHTQSTQKEYSRKQE
jgi:hypothetical protein